MSSHRSRPRRRRTISHAAALVLSPIFRHSRSRRAYILRGIGNRFGPVLQVRDGGVAARRGDADVQTEGDEAAPPGSGRFDRPAPVAESKTPG